MEKVDSPTALTSSDDCIHMVEKDLIGRHWCFLFKHVGLVGQQRRSQHEKFPSNDGRRSGLVRVRRVELWRRFDCIEYRSHYHRIWNRRVLESISNDVEYWRLKSFHSETN